MHTCIHSYIHRGGGDEATGKGQEDGAHRESVNETVCKIPDVLGGARKKVFCVL